MQAQGFGRKGFPAGSAAAAPAATLRPVAPAAARRDPYAEPRLGFVAQEQPNAAEDVRTLAWDTPTSGRSWIKSRLIAYLLWFFLGGLAAHRIYCGRYISAALQAMIGVVGYCALVISPDNIGTWGSLLLIQGVWFLFDLVLIPGMCRKPPAAY